MPPLRFRHAGAFLRYAGASAVERTHLLSAALRFLLLSRCTGTKGIHAAAAALYLRRTLRRALFVVLLLLSSRTFQLIDPRLHSLHLRPQRFCLAFSGRRRFSKRFLAASALPTPSRALFCTADSRSADALPIFGSDAPIAVSTPKSTQYLAIPTSLPRQADT